MSSSCSLRDLIAGTVLLPPMQIMALLACLVVAMETGYQLLPFLLPLSSASSFHWSTLFIYLFFCKPPNGPASTCPRLVCGLGPSWKRAGGMCRRFLNGMEREHRHGWQTCDAVCEGFRDSSLGEGRDSHWCHCCGGLGMREIGGFWCRNFLNTRLLGASILCCLHCGGGDGNGVFSLTTPALPVPAGFWVYDEMGVGVARQSLRYQSKESALKVQLIHIEAWVYFYL